MAAEDDTFVLVLPQTSHGSVIFIVISKQAKWLK
tara:strand:- start:739 stop:840 length:102 start_codon:yes stop_codon:yes gene_type:complete